MFHTWHQCVMCRLVPLISGSHVQKPTYIQLNTLQTRSLSVVNLSIIYESASCDFLHAICCYLHLIFCHIWAVIGPCRHTVSLSVTALSFSCYSLVYQSQYGGGCSTILRPLTYNLRKEWWSDLNFEGIRTTTWILWDLLRICLIGKRFCQ